MSYFVVDETTGELLDVEKDIQEDLDKPKTQSDLDEKNLKEMCDHLDSGKKLSLRIKIIERLVKDKWISPR